jgi:hypothetical protein
MMMLRIARQMLFHGSVLSSRRFGPILAFAPVWLAILSALIWAAPLAAQSPKVATQIELTASAPASEAGQSVTFTAVVTGDGGVPTGLVTFKDGEAVLGSVALSDGRANLATSALAPGQRTVTADYAGDDRFEGSSRALAHNVAEAAPAVRPSAPPAASEPKPAPDPSPRAAPDPSPKATTNEPSSTLVLLLAVLGLAAVILLRRIVFRWLLRPLARFVRAIFRRMRTLFRIGSRTRQRPGKSFFGLSVGAVADGFTETDDAIAADFDKASVRIDLHRRLICSWLHPELPPIPKYDRRDADEDFEKARLLFEAEVSIEANPLNLYDDIHNAFIVSLFRNSDKACFYVLSEFRKAINANVWALAAVFSLIVSLVAVLNLTASTSIEFYRHLNLSSLGIPSTLTVLDVPIDIPGEFNKAMFAVISCAFGFGLMWLFYQLAYEQSQRNNGQQLNNFLNQYLNPIGRRFEGIWGAATQAVVGDSEVHEMKRETVLWISNLFWMGSRVFFIEEFLRNILFQIRRNAFYTLLLVPLAFAALLLLVAGVFRQFGLLDLGSNVYRQYVFYLVFPLLLISFYRYLVRSLDPMSESIEGEWAKFKDLNFVEKLSNIMGAYAVQLDQWRSRFKQGPGSMG